MRLSDTVPKVTMWTCPFREIGLKTGNVLEEQYRYYDAAKIEGLTQRIHKLSQQLLSAEYGLALGQGRPEAT